MTLWFHSTILATSIVATAAVGIAGAASLNARDQLVSTKGDRLEIADQVPMSTSYVTVETRGDGVSLLSRLPAEIN